MFRFIRIIEEDKMADFKLNYTGAQINTILGNSLSTSVAASTYAPLTGVGASGTWDITITGGSKFLNVINPGGIAGSNHAVALKSEFDTYKSTIPRNRLINEYSSAYGNGSLCMGYFLSGYDSGPYGGFYVCHYGSAKYVGIVGGTYTEYEITKSATSSLRTKENIRIFNDDEAKKILQLNPIIFDYKKEFGGEKNQYGLIAEEVEKIIPYAVYTPQYDSKAEEQPIQSISYDKFIPYLIKMIQIQDKEIKELKFHIDFLKRKVGDING